MPIALARHEWGGTTAPLAPSDISTASTASKLLGVAQTTAQANRPAATPPQSDAHSSAAYGTSPASPYVGYTLPSALQPPQGLRAAANTPFPISAPLSSGRFISLGAPRKIWVIGAVHGDVDRLRTIHDEIGPLFQPGDRLVYLGNFIGVGSAIVETVDELLDFRRALIAMDGMLASDVVYLRGGQEEMWSKLLQIQFAPNPTEVMNWMLRQGAETTLLAYKGIPRQALGAAREGVMAMTRWTSTLRAEIRAHAGHEALFSSLRRAAYTGDGQNHPLGGALLFVNAGLDVSKPLSSQGDSFWWGAQNWGQINRSYGPFTKIIRGYDPHHQGAAMTPHSLTVDGGCGYGGALMAACLTPSGDVIDVIEA